jgi:anthranilate/para-aminobenzoate synthase component I
MNGSSQSRCHSAEFPELLIHLNSTASAGSSGRHWNFQSSHPSHVLRCDSRSLITTLRDGSGAVQTWADPLAALDWMANHPGSTSESRWVGYLSYDLGRLFETIGVVAGDDLQLPLFCFGLYQRTPAAPPAIAVTTTVTPGPVGSVTKERYLRQVARAAAYIETGDVFQVNLSQRFTAPLLLDPKEIWQNLCRRSPAVYGAYLEFGDHVLISNSPELFLHVSDDRTVTTRPIKGTRPNATGMLEELRKSVKDQAELNMIVDLERNDLGRVCEIGSVRVSEPRTIESHPTVFHGVATVQGKLRAEVSFVDLLRATFPGGSVTGAPKIRAMQIIEELEPVRRGPYCGAIGYLAADGSMQFNVAIRTMVVKDNQIHIPVGGGIVADSDPLEEYEETLTKAAAMFDALNVQP